MKIKKIIKHFTTFVLFNSALGSTQGQSQSAKLPGYKELLPRFQVRSAPSNTQQLPMREYFAKQASNFESCAGTLNQSGMIAKKGIFQAKSGIVALQWTYEKGKDSAIEIKHSDFRYENVESCLMRLLNEGRVESDDPEFKSSILVKFKIDCDLIKNGNALADKSCKIRWDFL